ncbi:TPA: tRNA (guanosine(37)-N1)-methyltransferase TrmD [Candidatus Uhrbacteria bacterium]|nr:tRNA (guanosine(37)-N1)-methyltransferase TrmD [Candidatus Uhrbacteria bacterium]
MKIQILTIFPEMVQPYLDGSILGRSQRGGTKLEAVQLRDFAEGKHAQVDDTPYGGGAGMVMKVEPIYHALKKLKPFLKRKGTHVIMTSAAGKMFTQKDAQRLAKEYDHLIFVCGRYEGVDQRVEDYFVDESFSIGGYVLTGGELPALVMTDAIVRNIPGVLGNNETLADESHNTEGVLEYPQYTKPEEFKGWNVPEVLLSGDHAAIARWREEKRKKGSLGVVQK